MENPDKVYAEHRERYEEALNEIVSPEFQSRDVNSPEISGLAKDRRDFYIGELQKCLESAKIAHKALTAMLGQIDADKQAAGDDWEHVSELVQEGQKLQGDRQAFEDDIEELTKMLQLVFKDEDWLVHSPMLPRNITTFGSDHDELVPLHLSFS